VTIAHDTSDAFSDETLREQTVFQYAKEAEMKEMLGNLAEGEIEFYQSVGRSLNQNDSWAKSFLQAMEEWERIIPIIQRIRVDV